MKRTNFMEEHICTNSSSPVLCGVGDGTRLQTCLASILPLSNIPGILTN